MTTSAQTTEKRDHRSWRAEAWRRYDFLSGQATAENLTEGDAFTLAHERLAEATDAIRNDNVDSAWQRLHAVEETLAAHATGEFLVDCAIEAYEHARDPALRARDSFHEVSTAWDTVKRTARDRSVPAGKETAVAHDVARVLKHAHWMTDQRHIAQNDCHRRLRNAAIGTALLSALVVAATLILSELDFLVASDSFEGVPSWQVVGLVVLGGLVGGMWGAVPAYIDARPDRYRMLDVRAAFRISLGVLSALLGVSLLGAGWVSGLSGDTAPSLFAVALAFGLAQEPVTRILEKKMEGATAPEQPTEA